MIRSIPPRPSYPILVMMALAALSFLGCGVAPLEIASGVVGALALATSTYTAYVQRQQVRAQVWPRLERQVTLKTGEGLTIGVANRGVGPAEIKRVRVMVDRKPAEDWPDAIHRLVPAKNISLSWLDALEDKVISGGAEIQCMTIDEYEDGRAVYEQLGRLGIEICFCSSLDDCWVHFSEGRTRRTVATSNCTADPKPFQTITEPHVREMLLRVSTSTSRAAHANQEDGGAPQDGATDSRDSAADSRRQSDHERDPSGRNPEPLDP